MNKIGIGSIERRVYDGITQNLGYRSKESDMDEENKGVPFLNRQTNFSQRFIPAFNLIW